MESKKIFIIEDEEKIREEFKNISEYKERNVEVEFNPDAGYAEIKIEEDFKENSDKRALILGSGWDKELASRINADLLIVSVPVSYRLIMNCRYAGYEGGLRVIEDIYDRVLSTYR